MESEQANGLRSSNWKTLTTVTSLSKYLALTLFISLPFMGGYIGYLYAPEKVIERVVTQEIENDVFLDTGVFSTTTIDHGEYSIQLTPTEILIYDSKSRKSVQSFELTVTNASKPETLVIVGRDINYDHYLDLGILQSVGPGSSLHYHFYTYDPELRVLVPENTLGDGFESERKTIVNPYFNIENRTVTSCQMGPLVLKQYRCQEFVFDGTGYTRGDSWTESWE